MSDKVHWTDVALVAIGAVMAFLSFRWLKKLFSSSDGKEGFSLQDFKSLVSLAFFLWAAIYIIVKEANRPSNSEHIFSEMWLAFVFCGLLYVLSMEVVFDKFAAVIKLLIDLRTARKIKNDEQTTT